MLGLQYVTKWWSTCVKGRDQRRMRGEEVKKARSERQDQHWGWGDSMPVFIPVLVEWVEGKVSSCSHLTKWGINIQWGSCFHNIKIILTLFSCRLWFDEFIGLWVSVQNLPQWEGVSIYFLPTQKEMHLKIPAMCLQDFDSNSHIMGSFSFCLSTRKQSQ